MIIFNAVVEGNSPKPAEVHIDEKLFPAIANGDRQAFEDLYTRTNCAVFSYALSLLKNYPDAEDAAQDTFLKIRSAAHLYEAKGKPLAWILTITRNICFMKLRQRGRTSDILIDELDLKSEFDKIADVEDKLVLNAAFETLSDQELQIIILHAVCALKHREISEIVKTPLSTAISKYNRGLKKLRKELEGKL